MRDSSLTLERELVRDDADRSARSARRRARLENRALLVAVLTVVMLVTLPRLHGIALRENELDALRVLDLLAPRVFAAEAESAALGAFLDQHAELERRLADVERLEGGALVRRHGYLFELARFEGRPCLRAWPYEHGRTGLGAFVSIAGAADARGALLAHPNETGEPWSGPGHAPRLVPDVSGSWRRVHVPGTWTESY